MIALNAHFDGKVIIPDEPLDLPTNQKLRLTLEPIQTAPPAKRQFGQQPDAFLNIAPDFDQPLPDDFWAHNDPEDKP